MKAEFDLLVNSAEIVTIKDVGGVRNRSVTNDMENVIQILVDVRILTPGKRLFYFDSMGDYSEVLLDRNCEFAGFVAASEGK